MSLCNVCKKSLSRTGQEKISCSTCGIFYHLTCVNLNKNILDSINESNPWICSVCVNKPRIADNRPKDQNTVVTVEIMEKMLDKFRADIIEAQGEKFSELRRALDTCVTKIDEISKSQHDQSVLLSSHSEDIIDLKTENAKLKSELSSYKVRTSDLEQYCRRNALEIWGVPYSVNDNPTQVVFNVAKSCGVSVGENDIDACHRLGPVKKDRPVPGIIVKFVCRTVANNIMSARESLRSLKVNQLGFKGDSPVFVNWSLSKERRAVFSYARKAKKEKRLTDVWIGLNGKIMVKQLPNHRPRIVSSTEDVDSLSVEGTN